MALGGWSEATTKEYEVKAAFIYNFTQFVEWPTDAFESADSPFIVGIAGPDPFDGGLERAMAGKTVGRHPITVKKFANADEVTACHLLFLPAGQENWMTTLTKRKRPILYVGEREELLDDNGMIRFFTVDNKLRFEINPDALARVGLRASSKLLKLAQIYRK